VEEKYLVCTKCNGYYKIKGGESPFDFELCQCGGELLLVNDIEDYFDHMDEYLDYYKNDGPDFDDNTTNKRIPINKSSLFLISIIIIIPLILIFNPALFNMKDPSSMQNHSLLGSDYRGYVVKDVYASSNTQSLKTIAIVTGIHPRETLSKNVTTDLIKKYPLSANERIVHYSIEVTNSPNDFTIGRNNGEGLAADYILPDILKSNDDLVIICHDHNPGYGQGFYIVTPKMDTNSVILAELINKSNIGFNYFKSDTSEKSSTANIRFSKPLAADGYKTFVYETPQWVSYNEAYTMTKSLIDKSFTII
jgi:hypothetical protein